MPAGLASSSADRPASVETSLIVVTPKPPAPSARPAARWQAIAAARAGLPDPAISALALTLYVALEWLSFLHEHDGLPVTPWNPGLGLMLALLIVAGPAYA